MLGDLNSVLNRAEVVHSEICNSWFSNVKTRLERFAVKIFNFST